MNPLINLIIAIQVLSATGTLAPGPLFVSNLIFGSREGWKAGLKMSIGHTIVEFPLFLMIAFGMFSVMMIGEVALLLGVLGGLTMIIFGILELVDALKSKGASLNNSFLNRFGSKGPLFMGIALSAFNPFFILWWLFIGSTFIYATLKILTHIFLPLIYLAHVWMDYVWLMATAHMSFIGKNVLKEKRYRYFIGALGLLLIAFGLHFITKSVFEYPLLPL